MICPNKNSQEWKSLVEKYGEAQAYVIFRSGLPSKKVMPPTRVETNPTYSTSRIFTDTLESLSKVYNFPYEIINDPNFKKAGYYQNQDGRRIVVINAAYATADTPFHEYFHAPVRVLKNTDAPLYNKVVQEAQQNGFDMEEEEAAVEYLGKLAAQRSYGGLLDSFLLAISRIIHSVTGKRIRLSSSSTVGDLVEQLKKGSIDISQENTLELAFQAIKDSPKLFATESNSEDIDVIGSLKQIAEDMPLTTSDTSVFYQNSKGEDAFRRLTTFVHESFSYKFKGRKETFATKQARKLFAENGISEDEMLTIGGNELSFDSVVKFFEAENAKAAKYGKAVHAYMQSITEPDPDLKKAALDEFYKYAADLVPGTYADPIHHPNFSFLKDEAFRILKDYAKIKKDYDGTERIPESQQDRVASEVQLHSDIMTDEDGNLLATKADIVIQHYNNEVSFVDYKTGDISSDWDTSGFMAFGDRWGINDSKLSRAHLDQALRVIMAKEKVPGMKVRELAIVRISKHGNHSRVVTDFGAYLGMIGDFYKVTKPEVYEKLKAKGLLDHKNYMGVDEAVVNLMYRIKDKPLHAQKKILEEEINSIKLNPAYKNSMPGYIREKLKQYTKAFLELSKLDGVNLDAEGSDSAFFLGGFKNFSDIEQPVVQTLHSEMQKASLEESKERAAIFAEHDRLARAIHEERASQTMGKKAARTFLKAALGVGIIGSNIYLIGGALVAGIVMKRLGVTTANYFDFMWRKSDEVGNPGYFMNTTNTTSSGRPLTEAEKNYRDFVQKSMRDKWSEVMNKPAYENRRGRSQSMAEVMGFSSELPENFMPRAPKDLEEVRESQKYTEGLGGTKTRVEYWVKKNLTTLFEDTYYGKGEFPGLSVKYYGHSGDGVVLSKAHTLNPEKAFRLFMGNLIHKDHFDRIYALAEGSKAMIEDKTNPDGTQKYKQLTKELDNLIGTVILQEPKEVKLTTKPIVIRPNSKLGKLMGLGDKPITINQDKALRTLKSGLSFGVMGWKATSAAFNGALITITNAMHLTKGIVGKIVGVNPDDWDADLGKSALGWKDYAGYLKDTMTGNAHNNKLWLMAKEFNWMPDNYDYDTGAPDLTYDTTRPTLNSYAFMFHNMVESYGALTHLAVLSRSVKLTNATGEKFSIYDAYDVKDGKLVWTKGSRGKKLGANGIQEDLNELDFREVKSLKRANERMHGSYRKEEQVAISATVWGEFLLQFKKFFYTFLKGLYGSPYNDITVGKYVLNKNISRPDGVPVWE
jgi:hypothetical protein